MAWFGLCVFFFYETGASTVFLLTVEVCSYCRCVYLIDFINILLFKVFYFVFENF